MKPVIPPGGQPRCVKRQRGGAADYQKGKKDAFEKGGNSVMKTRRRSLLKRGLSFFIAMTMCLSMLQMPVFAAEESYAKESAVTEISVQGGLSGEGLSENRSTEKTLSEKTSSEEASEKNDRVEADDKENKEDQSAKAKVKEEKEASKEVSDGAGTAEETPEKAGTAEESSDKDVSVNDAGDGKDAANAAGDGEDAANGAENGNDAVNSAGHKEKPGENTSEKEEFTDKISGKEEVTDGAADKDSAEKNSGKEESAGNNSGTETVDTVDKASNEEKPAADKTDKQPTDTENQDKSKPAEVVKADKKVQESTGTKASSQAKASSRIPGAVKVFLDAVAAIPEITPDNAEEAAEYIYGEVSDAYEELLGTENEDREDVQKAAAVMHKAMAAVDAAMKEESYATVDELNAAFEVVGEVLESGDIQAGIDALDAYLVIYHRLSPKDQEANAEAMEAAMAYQETLRGSLEGIEEPEIDTLRIVDKKINIRGATSKGNPSFTQNTFQVVLTDEYNNKTPWTVPAASAYFTLNNGCTKFDYAMVTTGGYTHQGKQSGLPISVEVYSGGTVTYYFKDDHTYAWEKTKEPTCYSDGVRSYKCTKCGHVNKTESIPASENYHTWGNWYNNGAGKEQRDCNYNYHHEYRDIQVQQVTLIYDGNGNTSGTTPTSQTVNKGGKVTIKNKGSLERKNYTFWGWSCNKSDTVPEYEAGDEITLNENTTLYAVWKKDSPGTRSGNFIVKKSFSGLDGVEPPKVTLTYRATRTKDGNVVGSAETGTVALTWDGVAKEYNGTITPTVWDISTNGADALSDNERSRYKNVIVITETDCEVDGYCLTSFAPFNSADGTANGNSITFTLDGAMSQTLLSLKNTYTENASSDDNITLTYMNGNDEWIKETYSKGAQVSIKNNGPEAPEGKEFVGWNTKDDGTGENWKGTTQVLNNDTILYATWKDTDDYTKILINKIAIVKAPDGTIRGDGKARPGDIIQYRITVTNNSSKEVSNVVIVDNLDSNLKFVEAESNINPKFWGGEPENGEYNFAKIDAGKFLMLTIIAKVKDDAPDGTIKNIATVKCDGMNDPKPSNPADVTVEKPAPVSITKKADKTSAKVGDTINYTVTIVNKTNQQQKVTFKDVIPKGLKLEGNMAYDSIDVVGDVSGGDTQWSFTLNGEVDAKITFMYSVTVQEEADSPLTNTATATVDGKNYQDSVSVTVNEQYKVQWIVREDGKSDEIRKTDARTDEKGKTVSVTEDDKKVTFDGYTLKETESTLIGTLKDDLILKLVYVKNGGNNPGPDPTPTEYTVTVKYQDEKGNSIRDDATESTINGGEYDVNDKKVTINGYTYQSADKALSGKVTENTIITLFYKKNTTPDPTPEDPDSKYKVTVYYRYEDGSKAANDAVRDNLSEGTTYSITSPSIDGYTPDQSVVSGTMGTADIEVTVTYKKNGSGGGGGSGDTPETPDREKITATWLPGYGNNEPIQTEEYDKGIREIPTTDYPENPVREGYTFDGWNDPVRDGEGNITITAKWKPAGTISTFETHKVTIHYTYADGNKAADDVVRDNLAEGTAYSITSPSINGYTPDQTVVNGTMGTGDVEITVIYTQNNTNNPDNGSGTESNPGNEGNGNGPGDGGNSNGSGDGGSGSSSGGRGSGGGGGGGSSATNLSGRVHGTTPSPETAVTVPGDGVPLADVPAGEIPEGTGADIPDEDVPLAGIPLADIPDADVPLSGFTGLTGIPDEDVPLASVPKTGDRSGLWHMMALLSAFSLMAMTMVDKKKRQEKEQEN